MVSINYGAYPSAPDLSGFERGLAGLGDIVAERRTRKSLTDPAFLDWLEGGQGGGGEMSLASLAPRDQQVARAPLPPAQDPASARVAQAHAVSGDPGTYRNAIKSIESAGSGDYAAVGPAHPQLGRALGAYQVMEANVGPWSKEVFGKEMTPEQFLANPKAQDAIFDRKFGGYVQKFGSPEKAAQAWFAGEGGVGTDRQDSLGTSVPEYSQKFAQALGGGSGASQGVQMAQSAPAGTDGLLPPPDVMRGLLANKGTREFGILIAREAQKARRGDPEAALRMEKLRLEVEKERTQAPGLVELFDEATGQPYKARYNPQTGEYDRVGGIKAPSGSELSIGPNGEVTFRQGSGLGKVTEAQSKDINYFQRGRATLPTINEFEKALASPQEAVAGSVPYIGNFMISPDYQRGLQAGREFLAAILRKDTGAAVTKAEFDLYGPMFLPTPGDSEEVLGQKRVARERAMQAIQTGLGGMGEALPEPQANPKGSGLPAGVTDEDVEFTMKKHGMTREQVLEKLNSAS